MRNKYAIIILIGDFYIGKNFILSKELSQQCIKKKFLKGLKILPQNQ